MKQLIILILCSNLLASNIDTTTTQRNRKEEISILTKTWIITIISSILCGFIISNSKTNY